VSVERERWERWDEQARNVAKCSDCTVESHVRSIRFLMAEAYEDGYLDGRKSLRVTE
jgi:hypothetical protein